MTEIVAGPYERRHIESYFSNPITKWEKQDLNYLIDLITNGEDLQISQRYALCYAVDLKNENVVDLLSKKSVDRQLLIDVLELMTEECSEDFEGITKYKTCNVPLHRAVILNCPKIVCIFIKNGADVNFIDQCICSKPALSHAVLINSLDMVKLLIKNGASINSRGVDEKFPLHYAIDVWEESKYGDYVFDKFLMVSMDDALARMLLVNNVTEFLGENNEKIDEYLTILEENMQIINFLLLNGADVNLLDAYGYTALNYSLSRDIYELLCVLLKDYYNEETKKTELNRVLVNNLFSAVVKHNDAIVKILFQRHEKRDAKRNRSFLNSAVKGGKLSIVKALLEAGVNINSLDTNEVNPLIYVCDTRVSAMVKLLAEEMSTAAFSLEYPLNYDLLQLKLAKILIESGAEVNSEYGTYGSLLGKSIENVNYEISKLFLDNGAYVNGMDITALPKPGSLVTLYGSVHFRNSKLISINELYDIALRVVLLLFDYSSTNKLDHDLSPVAVDYEEIEEICLLRLRNAHTLVTSVEKVFVLGLCGEDRLSDRRIDELKNSVSIGRVETEVELLKATKLSDDCNFTFYDVLTKRFEWLIEHLFFNTAYKEILQSNFISEIFPIYESMIRACVSRCYCRIDLLHKAHEIIVNHTYVLPVECTFKILNYLPDSSLNLFIWSFRK